jgi:rhamnopyranosyl-N-acetylglucosaminyl-diphospho-decaprenol beta-1,3/1,4-galactofuranosyltransferase
MLGSIWDYSPVSPVAVQVIKGDFFDIECASFVGVAYSHKLIERIGLPKREFFVHFDDYEYNRRVVRICKIRLVLKSRIRHKEARNTEIGMTKSFLGRRSYRIKYDKLWFYYYGFRNYFWLRMKENRLRAYLYLSKDLLKKIITILLYDDHKIRRMLFWLSAANDARKGVFENAKPRRILYG